MNFNRRVLPMAPYRCTILSLQLLPCWNRTFDYFLFMCTHMIAKLFSEPCQHKSCIHKPKQDPCFCSSLCSVTHQRRLCIANRTNLWGSFAALLLSLCLAQCPPPPGLLQPNSYIYFVWFIKPYSPDVRHSRPGVSWGSLLLKIFVLCLDSFKQQHPLHPELTPT